MISVERSTNSKQNDIRKLFKKKLGVDAINARMELINLSYGIADCKDILVVESSASKIKPKS